MRVNYNAIPEYRLWRNGSSKKAGSKGMPGSKIQKKIVRAAIKRSIRGQRINLNKGNAEHYLKEGVLIDIHGKPVKRFTSPHGRRR